MLTFPNNNTYSDPKCCSYSGSNQPAKCSANAGTDWNTLSRPNQRANKQSDQIAKSPVCAPVLRSII